MFYSADNKFSYLLIYLLTYLLVLSLLWYPTDSADMLPSSVSKPYNYFMKLNEMETKSL